MITPNEILDTREFEAVVVTNEEGRIILNGPQQDLIIVRNRYVDHTVDIWSRPAQGGELTLVLPRYNPEETGPSCRHCGEKL